jgi:hypothetical protein
MAETQLSELRNMRVLLEEARGLARNLAYHRRARLETKIVQVLDEVEPRILLALRSRLKRPLAPPRVSAIMSGSGRPPGLGGGAVGPILT